MLPAGSVRSVAHGSYNDEIRFSFTVQPAPVLVDAVIVQTDPADLDVDVAANRAAVLARIASAAAAGGDLIVFPELSLTGTRFASRAEAASVAETVPGPSVDALVAQAQASSAYAVVGLVESDGAALYDTLVLVGPEGLVGKHRKTHLAPHEKDVFDARRPVARLRHRPRSGRAELRVREPLPRGDPQPRSRSAALFWWPAPTPRRERCGASSRARARRRTRST